MWIVWTKSHRKLQQMFETSRICTATESLPPTQRKNRQPNQQQQPRQQQQFQFQHSPQLEGFEWPLPKGENQQKPKINHREEEEVQPRSDGSLYSASELMKIMVEIIRVKKNAKTQEDQLLAVSGIIDKYSNHGFTR
jgi:hypothetical protein